MPIFKVTIDFEPQTHDIELEEFDMDKIEEAVGKLDEEGQIYHEGYWIGLVQDEDYDEEFYAV